MIEQIKDKIDIKIQNIKPLDGYDSANHLLKGRKKSYILKTYDYSKPAYDLVAAENDVLLYLAEHSGNQFPKPVSFVDSALLKVLKIEGEKKICRLLTFLQGEFMGGGKSSPALLRSLGRFLAEMDKRLQGFDNYVYKSREWEWDIQHFQLNRPYMEEIENAHSRNLVKYFYQQFREVVAPVLPKLRKGTIHNDANEWNILTHNNEVTGLIDFGDVTFAPLINELAVAITYACYKEDQPLENACVIIEAYHDFIPLEKQEINVLYYLIAARLCISICNSAHSKRQNPGNEYASISENHAWKMLFKWLQLNPVEVRNRFLSAVGYPLRSGEELNALVERRLRVMDAVVGLSYNKPVHMERSAFQYMYDATGNTYLDAYNNIPHVGHLHPKVVEAGQRQMAKLNTNTRYVYDLLPEYAEKLLSRFPVNLNKVFFVNSGSEASDLAMRLALAHSGNNSFMVMEHGYHGNTQRALAISDYKFSKPNGPGQDEHILKTPLPNVYRNPYAGAEENVGTLYAREAIKSMEDWPHSLAAFVSEPIVGCGGQVPLAPGYLKEIYPAVRQQGGVCISDEVQTGFGRLGTHYWGFEAHEVTPDIVILGKPMGNGHPMAAVVTTTPIAKSFGRGVEFFSSFGGNPVSCAIGLSVLEVMDEEKLQENAKDVGTYYASELLKLKNNYNCIGDVRGSGLFIGIELVKPGTKEPNTALAQKIKNELRKQHILISTDGPFDSVLKTKPPLCFTRENAKTVVKHIGDVLAGPK